MTFLYNGGTANSGKMVLTYLITVIVCYSSIFFGILLGKISEEELDLGEKYFLILKKLLFLSILFISGYVYNLIIGMIYFIIGLVIIFSLKILFKKIKQEKVVIIEALYLFFISIFFSFSVYKDSAFLISSSLFFLYGLITGTLMKKNKLKLGRIIGSTIHFCFITIIMILSMNVY